MITAPGSARARSSAGWRTLLTLWASVFAHLSHHLGRRLVPALNAELARLAFATPWKWAYDVVVAVMCSDRGTGSAGAVTASWGRHLSRRLIFTLACIGSTLLVLGRGEPDPGGLFGGDRPVHGLGDLGTLVLPGRHTLHPEHVALETRPVVPWIPAWTR